MSLVRGENFVFWALDAGQYKTFACARSGNMSIDTDVIETTGPGTGNFRTFEATVHSFSVSLDGVVSLNESGMLTLPDLQALQLAKTKIYCRYMHTSEDSDVYRKEFWAIITNSTDTGSFDGIATFSISLKGTGAITQIFTPPSPTTGQMYRYPAMGNTAPPTTGAYTWSTGLTDKTIINVVKDGRGSSNIILTGTPVGNEVLYDSITGDFTWAVPFEDGETPPYIEYQNS